MEDERPQRGRRVASGFEQRSIPDRLAEQEAAKPKDPALVLRMLQLQVEALQHELAATSATVVKVARGEKVDEIPQARTMRFKLWVCYSCGGRLGNYDQEKDEMAAHSRDIFWWFHAGKGGYMKTICRQCCAENRVDDTDE